MDLETLGDLADSDDEEKKARKREAKLRARQSDGIEGRSSN